MEGTAHATETRAIPGSRAIALVDVTIAYDRRPIVHHLTGSFQAGGPTALVGPNGAGKSTLLKAIAGLLPLQSGRVEMAPDDRRRFAFLPQAAEVDRSFPLAVIDVVDFGHWRHVGAFGRIGANCRWKSQEAIATVGLSGTEHAPISHLSLGQMQRVLFARLIVQDAPVILLDEPFNGVDSATLADLMAIVAQWGRDGRIVIAALHDLDQIRLLFPETLLMAREKVAWGKTEEVLGETNLTRARELARAWSDPAEICRRVA